MAEVIEISLDRLVHGENKAQDTIEDNDLLTLFNKAQNLSKNKRKPLRTTYSKIEKGLRYVTVIELHKMTQLFNLTVDQIISLEDDVPKAVVLYDKTEDERFKLINQLDEEDKNTVLQIIDKMLTNKKFKDLFDKNLASL